MSCPVAPPTDAWEKCALKRVESTEGQREVLMQLSHVAFAPVGVCHGRKDKRTEAMGPSFVGVRRI